MDAVDYVPPTQRGVLYFSSVPRDMRPNEVRAHFSRFGPILRHKFVPFRKKERRPGGPLLPLQFQCGHMEFARADDARSAAAAMNATAVDCKRRRKCFGQLWTVKFLDGFTWDSLLEEREERTRSRRDREAEARGAERANNEAFRAAVMAQRSAKRAKRVREEEEEKKEEKKESAEGERERERRRGGTHIVKRAKKETESMEPKIVQRRQTGKVKNTTGRREKAQ